MVGESRLASICVLLVILILSSITPFALLYYIAFVTAITLPSSHLPIALHTHFSHPTPSYSVLLLRLWLAMELLFFLYYYHALRRFQVAGEYTLMSTKHRYKVFHAVLDELRQEQQQQQQQEEEEEEEEKHTSHQQQKQHTSHPSYFFQGWFYSLQNKHHPVQLEDIYRGNMAEWLGVVLFSTDMNGVAEDTVYRDQVYAMVDQIQDTCQIQFHPGYNPHIACLRLGLDPVKATHRPFILYVCAWIADAACKCVLACWGFTRYGRKPRSWVDLALSVLAPHPSHAQSRPSHTTPRITYWYRPGFPTPTPAHPIMFIHGVGCGIVPYLGLIYRLLLHSKQEQGVFLVELPHVAMRMYSRAPSFPRTIYELCRALDLHESSRPAVWVGHSLGSAVVAAACRFAPNYCHAPVFIDPICFKLHLPHVTYNFLYKQPHSAREHFMAYFAGQELFNHRYFHRDFHWFHANLLSHDIHTLQRASVFLSEQDMLVPSQAIAQDLHQRWGVSCSPGDTVKTKHACCSWWWMEGLDHAQFLFRGSWCTTLVDRVMAVSRSSSSSD